MISCKHCHTPNSLDSVFCKRCGVEIPADDLKEAQAKLDRLIEEGNSLFNQARVDEALGIADAAVAANPSSTSALSLKALCHERRGEMAEALEAADRIVELNPDSDFDRIRRSTLRQKLQAEYQLSATPDRKTALIGAVAAVILVVCAGVYAARMSPATKSSGANVVASNTAAAPQYQAQAVAPGQTASNPAQTEASQTTNQNNQPSGGGDRTSDNQADDRGDPSRVGPIRAPRSGGDQDPAPTYTGGGLPPVTSAGDIHVAPFPAPDPNPQTSTGVVTAPASKPSPNDPDVDTQGPNAKSSPAPESDQGTIDIVVRRPGSSGTGRVASGSQSGSDQELQVLLRAGSQQYELGNYEAAARSYEQAIQKGGDAIILNRRLGQAYQRLGRTSDAADAYKRCISAVEAALAAGRGNRDTLMSTRDLCLQAIKVLGG